MAHLVRCLKETKVCQTLKIVLVLIKKAQNNLKKTNPERTTEKLFNLKLLRMIQPASHLVHKATCAHR